MAQETGQEKTEQATPKRKSDAKKKGETLRSKELTTFLSLMVAGAGIFIFGAQIINDLLDVFRQHLNVNQQLIFSKEEMLAKMAMAVREFSVLLLPFLGMMLVSVTCGPLMLGGWSMSADQIKPKLERIDPVKGFGRIFSMRSLAELVKALAKFLLVAFVVILIIGVIIDDILHLSSLPLLTAISSSAGFFMWSFLGFSAVLILVVAFDVPFQIWSFDKKLKMTKQEIKDELKETEGRPEVKQAVREKQQELSMHRMIAAVPDADVVVTNPTHFAVALKYEEGGSGAPVVVAKGRDLVAANIREVASSHNVCVFEAPPLARALYASTRLNQQIPEDLFLAVAQVLAYVFQLRNAEVAKKKPVPPRNLPVPEEYDSQL